MYDNSEVRIIKTDKKKNIVMGLVTFAIGALFVYLVHGVGTPTRNQNAALLLGYLLIFIGGSGIVLNEEIETQIDTKRKMIRSNAKNLFTNNSRLIPFSLIAHTALARVGRASNITHFYFLIFVLKSGESIQTGYFNMSQSEAFQEATRLAQEVGCEASQHNIANPEKNTTNFILALAAGVIFYALYFRSKIGPWCPAMWAGNAPPLIIISATWATFVLLRQIRK